MSESNGLTAEQTNFLQGFAIGADVSRAIRGLPVISGSASAAVGETVTIGPLGASVGPATPRGPERLQFEAQERALAEGKTLCKEEQAKRVKDPLTMYDEIQANARAGVFPKDTDVIKQRTAHDCAI